MFSNIPNEEPDTRGCMRGHMGGGWMNTVMHACSGACRCRGAFSVIHA